MDIEKAIEFYKAKSYEEGGIRDRYTRLAIEALEKQLNGGWIPVSERLPEKSGKYLITIKNLTGFEMPKEYIFICDYFHAIKEFMFDSWEDNKIVAWQPLPPAYKEVENE
jgi:hypothetical protein